MEFKIKGKHINEINDLVRKAKGEDNVFYRSYTYRSKPLDGDYLEESMVYELNELDKAQLDKVTKWVNTKYSTNAQELKSLYRACKITRDMRDGKDAIPRGLKDFKEMAIERLARGVIVIRKSDDGIMLPYVCTEVKHKGRSEDYAAHINIELKASHTLRGVITRNVHVYTTDIGEEEWDGDKERMVTKNTKKFTEILMDKNIYIADEESKAELNSSEDLFDLRIRDIGGVYISDGGINERRKYGESSYIPITNEIHDKLVLDEAWKDTSYGSKPINTPLPRHLYLPMFNLTRHHNCEVYVTHAIPYKWKENLSSRLVIPRAHSELINVLIRGTEGMEDKDLNKTGGMIIMATGEAGLGKTLTAEVFSETLNKPLYSVQSSQLGIKVDEIEKNLKECLFRAQRWNAVLLIDEADSYVRKRDNDMAQNAVVGTFLRVLEYYNGVLFMTTNRPEIIDDAIMSRVAAHFKYEAPDRDALKQIWSIHSDQFKLGISEDDIDKLSEFKITGRDVRNACKLMNRFVKYGEKRAGYDLFMELKSVFTFAGKIEVEKN